MVDFKELEEGMSIGGVYTLENCIRQDRDGAFFAVSNVEGERLLIKLASGEDSDAERQLATWQRSRQLRHAHLLHLRDVGRAELPGNSYIYGVFEYPDDVLAPALEQGPLSEPETRGVLESVLAALRYLHGQGLVHGAIDPDHIFAVGDEVKLSTDALRESDDLEGHPEDVRQLGELVRTLRSPEPLSEPFATIVRHATTADAHRRWTLAEIARVIESAPAVTTVAPPMPAPAPPAVTPVALATPEPLPAAATPVTLLTPEQLPPADMPITRSTADPAPSPITPLASAIPEPVLPAATPVGPVLPPPFHPVRSEADVRSPGGFPKWIIAGLAILLFSILIFNLRRKPEADSDSAPVTQPVTAPVAKPAAAPVTKPAAAPVAPAAHSADRHITPAAAVTPPSERGIWRVIAFTFRSRDMAAKKVKQIDDRWPDLRAEVFAPKGRRGYYLVALGNGMNREEAARVQRKARSLGLPRDTYVQNYSE